MERRVKHSGGNPLVCLLLIKVCGASDLQACVAKVLPGLTSYSIKLHTVKG